MEIVTAPDFRSPDEVRAFLAELEEVLEYLGIFDAERDGSLRIDANLSIIPEAEIDGDNADEISADALEAANRTEVKNISSHKGAQKALAYEETRQRTPSSAVGRSNRRRATGTRLGDHGLDAVERRGERLPVLRGGRPPAASRLGLEGGDRDPGTALGPTGAIRRRVRSRREAASKLTSTKQVADFYEDVAGEFDPDLAATWVADNLLGELNYRDIEITEIEGRLEEVKRLVALVDEDEITAKTPGDGTALDARRRPHPDEVVAEEGWARRAGTKFDRPSSKRSTRIRGRRGLRVGRRRRDQPRRSGHAKDRRQRGSERRKPAVAG